MSHSRKPKGIKYSALNSRGKNSATPRHTRKQERGRDSDRTTGTLFTVSLGVGLAIAFILGLACIVFIGHQRDVVSASGGPYPGPPTLIPRHVCGTAGQPACPPDDPGWFSVPSQSPIVVAAAIAGSEYFNMMMKHYAYTALDTPVLVHAYGPHTGIQYYDDDHWVVSVRNASGKEVGVFDFVYDSTRQHLRFSSFGVMGLNDPHAYQAFPYTPASVAIAQLQRQRKLSVMVGTQPELIFFPIDPRWRNLNSPVHLWKGGGEAPMDPMWHIVGADGHNYFVGVDLNVYVQQNLPFAPGGQP